MSAPFRPAALALTVCALASTAAIAAVKPARAPAAPQIIPLPLKQIIPPTQRLCTAKTASGLGYRILRGASGARPVGDATVTVNYIGYLATDGEVFDQGMAVSFPMQKVIPGFSEGLALMPAGSVYRLCIPARLGYGDQGAGPVPPNADLVFQVELLPAPPQPARGR